MDRRIMVTGAAGFIGTHVCRALLDEDFDVVGVDNFDPFYDRAIKEKALAELACYPSFSFREVDVRNQDSLRSVLDGIDAVVHLAGRAGVRQSVLHPELYSSINTGGTVTTLKACHEVGVRSFVLGSSSSVYGNNTPVPFREDAPSGEPCSPYAASKKAAELACQSFAQRHGFRVAALRFFTVYGPRQRPDLAIQKFTRLIQAGKKVSQYGDGSTERDYTWVGDIARGVRCGLEWTNAREPAFEIFNLGMSRPVRLDQLIQHIGKALDIKPRIEQLPMVAGDVARTWADVRKSRRVLGYDPRVRIEDGINRFVRWHDRVRTVAQGAVHR